MSPSIGYAFDIYCRWDIYASSRENVNNAIPRHIYVHSKVMIIGREIVDCITHIVKRYTESSNNRILRNYNDTYTSISI